MTVRNGIRFATAPLAAACLAAVSAPAAAQTMTFSIDWTGATVGAADSCTGVPITEGDILAPANALGAPAFGPLPAPCIAITGGPGGLGIPTHPGCVGHPGGTQCPVEVDALSYARDHPVQPNVFQPANTFAFSVDECAFGVAPNPRPPAVWTEGPVGDAAADVFADGGLPPGPLGPVPPVPVPGSYGFIDGDGLPSPTPAVYPGTGLIEPNLPGVPDGDNLDAVDLDTFGGPAAIALPVWFSLDGRLPNPCTAAFGSGSAMINGFLSGDVLMTPAAGAAPVVYAPAFLLGLDVFGQDTDDLDALALWENGVPGYQPSPRPYDWATGIPGAGFPDMLLFSVRKGSAVIGMPDSIFGAPIEEGDILVPPLPTAMGGVSPFPGIFVAAEWNALATVRSGAAVADELDALDTRRCPPPGEGYCFGDGSGTPCPCGNFGLPGNGCDHSFGFGGGNLAGSGKAIVSADTLTLNATNLPPTTVILFFQASAPNPVGAVFGDGLLCTSGAVIRLGARITAAGAADWGAAVPTVPISIGGAVPAVGGTRYYQGWYRNAAAFCTAAPFNLTNGYAVVWVP